MRTLLSDIKKYGFRLRTENKGRSVDYSAKTMTFDSFAEYQGSLIYNDRYTYPCGEEKNK